VDGVVAKSRKVLRDWLIRADRGSVVKGIMDLAINFFRIIN